MTSRNRMQGEIAAILGHAEGTGEQIFEFPSAPESQRLSLAMSNVVPPISSGGVFVGEGTIVAFGSTGILGRGENLHARIEELESRVATLEQLAAASIKSTPPPNIEVNANRFLKRLAKQAMRSLTGQGFRRASTRIYRWQSVEDPTWRQAVLEIGIMADPETGLKVWDDLSGMFQEALASESGAQREAIKESVSLSVVWEPRPDV